MTTYAIEVNGSFVKEYKSLKRALKWVFSGTKIFYNQEDPVSVTIWKFNNHQREYILTNCL